MKKTDVGKFEIYKIALKEAKYNFDNYMKTFDDIKSKVQIYLLTSSLIFGLSIFNATIMDRIMNTDKIVFVFILGLILIIIAIILLFTVLKDITLQIPQYMHILKMVDKESPETVVRALVKGYDRDLQANVKKMRKRRTTVRYAEDMIIMGLILIVFAILYVIL